jgi:hypothetical protein
VRSGGPHLPAFGKCGDFPDITNNLRRYPELGIDAPKKSNFSLDITDSRRTMAYAGGVHPGAKGFLLESSDPLDL